MSRSSSHHAFEIGDRTFHKSDTATIACRGRTSDGYIPDLRVAAVPIVTIIGTVLAASGAFPKKRPNRARNRNACHAEANHVDFVGSAQPCAFRRDIARLKRTVSAFFQEGALNQTSGAV